MGDEWKMRLKEFSQDFIVSKLVNKFQQVAFILFIGTAMGKIPPLISVIGLTLFLFTYFSTYFYNDLMDIEEDSKLVVNTPKVLHRGIATPKEFISLGVNLALVGGVLTTLWDPILGLLALIAVLVNNLRSHIRALALRQLLLAIVEFVSLEAFWQVLYGELAPGVIVPVLLVYASMYAALHIIYKDLARGARELRASIRKPAFLMLIAIALVSAVFSIPALLGFTFHFLVLLLGALGYLSFIYFIGISKRFSLKLEYLAENTKRVLSKRSLSQQLSSIIDKIFILVMRLTKLRFSLDKVNNYSLFLLGVWLLAAAIATHMLPSPQYGRLSFILRVPKGIYEVVRGIDNTQAALLSSPVLRGVKGLKDNIKLSLKVGRRG